MITFIDNHFEDIHKGHESDMTGKGAVTIFQPIIIKKYKGSRYKNRLVDLTNTGYTGYICKI